jgi:hypothetical protein
MFYLKGNLEIAVVINWPEGRTPCALTSTYIDAGEKGLAYKRNLQLGAGFWLEGQGVERSALVEQGRILAGLRML